MNLVGERRKPAEGAKLSGAVKSGTIRGHDSGESRYGCGFAVFRYGRRRCTEAYAAFLSLRQKDREKFQDVSCYFDLQTYLRSSWR